MESPALLRLREEYKLDETNDDFGINECWRSSRNWSCGTCEWNSAGTVASTFSGCAKSNESENHSRYTVVSMDVATFCLDGGALPV